MVQAFATERWLQTEFQLPEYPRSGRKAIDVEKKKKVSEKNGQLRFQGSRLEQKKKVSEKNGQLRFHGSRLAENELYSKPVSCTTAPTTNREKVVVTQVTIYTVKQVQNIVTGGSWQLKETQYSKGGIFLRNAGTLFRRIPHSSQEIICRTRAFCRI